MSNELAELYMKMQREFNAKPGDKVRILRVPTKDEMGWVCPYQSDLKKYNYFKDIVGKEGIVGEPGIYVFEEYGINIYVSNIETGPYTDYFVTLPWFVLEKVEPTVKVEIVYEGKRHVHPLIDRLNIPVSKIEELKSWSVDNE